MTGFISAWSQRLGYLLELIGEAELAEGLAEYIEQRKPVPVPALLRQNGFIAVISFHSLEDRIVKMDFKSNEKNGVYKIITKKPISASRDEVSENHRARSAKLRIAQKV